MDADLRAVLDLERHLISLDDDAAQATSLDQINADYTASTTLDNQFGDAVDHLRLTSTYRLPQASARTQARHQHHQPQHE